MNPSDVFKLSTLATAIVAIMPALANATEPADPITDPKIVQKGNAYEVDDKNKTVKITKADDEKQPLELTGDDATHGKVEDSEVNVAGIFVGVDNSNNVQTATYEGASINVNVQTENDATASTAIAAAAADGTSANKKASQLNLGKAGVSEIKLTAKNASTNEGSAFAAYAANGATVDIKGKSLVASATTNKGKAGVSGVAYPEAAAGLFADGDNAKANVNVTTTGLIDISATSIEGQAYGILAKGAAGSAATDNTKAGTVTLNGGEVNVKANTTGDANRTYAV